MAIKIDEIKQTQALTETDETKDTSHLVNANKKLKTPLTSKDMSHLGKLYMTLFERLEPQSESRTMAVSQMGYILSCLLYTSDAADEL